MLEIEIMANSEFEMAWYERGQNQKLSGSESIVVWQWINSSKMFLNGKIPMYWCNFAYSRPQTAFEMTLALALNLIYFCFSSIQSIFSHWVGSIVEITIEMNVNLSYVHSLLLSVAFALHKWHGISYLLCVCVCESTLLFKYVMCTSICWPAHVVGP